MESVSEALQCPEIDMAGSELSGRPSNSASPYRRVEMRGRFVASFQLGLES